LPLNRPLAKLGPKKNRGWRREVNIRTEVLLKRAKNPSVAPVVSRGTFQVFLKKGRAELVGKRTSQKQLKRGVWVAIRINGNFVKGIGSGRWCEDPVSDWRGL